MIGSLRGQLVARWPSGEIVVEVGGIGYRVQVAPRTIVALGQVGGDVMVHTHLHVREEALTLFGFPTVEERDCFEALVGARGVGPALALAILSVHSPGELHRVLTEGDLDALTLVPGVGRKTAARLLMELKARLHVPEPDPATTALADGSGPPPARAEVRAALAGLGYGPDEVGEALRDLPAEGEVEDLLRAALKQLAVSR
jgi:Holliday junction DNA helicase RuvA